MNYESSITKTIITIFSKLIRLTHENDVCYNYVSFWKIFGIVMLWIFLEKQVVLSFELKDCI